MPLPDEGDALRELEYALDTLSLDGVALVTNVAGRYPAAFPELFAELNRRKTVVFMHPDAPPGEQPDPSVPAFLAEFVFETTRAVVNLLFSGTLERCPNVRLILSHAGGTVPYIAMRLVTGQFLPGLQEKVPQGVLAYLQRLYYDTALSAAPFALRSLQELADPSHILFGSDYPFAPELAAQMTFAGLEEYNGWDPATLKAIYSGNAAPLFPATLTGGK